MVPAQEPSASVDLGSLEWRLEGWRQWDWKLMRTVEAPSTRRPDIGPIRATVPGSVRGALVAAGLVADPFHSVRSRDSEFIENRHWIYRAVLPCELSRGNAFVCFQSLDGVGEVWLGGRRLAGFGNTHRAVSIPLGWSRDIREQELAIVFLTPPDELGQVGWTSKITAWKPRFNYGWDWTPRIVQIGPAKPVTLRIIDGPVIDQAIVATDFTPSPIANAPVGRGTVTVAIRFSGLDTVCSLKISVLDDGGKVVAERKADVLPVPHDATPTFTIADLEVQSWWATRSTPKPMRYTVELELLASDGRVVDRATRRVGFRSLTWHSNPGSPEGAEPWLLHIDGAPEFLQGVNWVPIRPDYADVPDDAYRDRLTTYRNIGVNLVRVWGGASIEREIFYDLCDELGLLVWQDLPLSSSGIDNIPPQDPEFVEEFAAIAREFACQLVHRACVAVWCGGNELAARPGERAADTPLDFGHPALSAARDAIREIDTSRRLVPTSPSGPRYVADESEFGKGVHHDVHGPWTSAAAFDAWQRYWETDDALFRSEVGVAGASDLALIERYGLTPDIATSDIYDLWRHSAAWWMDESDRPTSNAALRTWIIDSQARQAELLSIAARASKRRFPECGGFVVWMGHDAFPCPVSLSIVDFDGNLKPAGHALAEVFGQ